MFRQLIFIKELARKASLFGGQGYSTFNCKASRWICFFLSQKARQLRNSKCYDSFSSENWFYLLWHTSLMFCFFCFVFLFSLILPDVMILYFCCFPIKTLQSTIKQCFIFLSSIYYYIRQKSWWFYTFCKRKQLLYTLKFFT